MNAKALSALERNILKAKGLTEAQLKKLSTAGIRCKEDFRTVGDAATLSELIGVSADVAAKVMSWALTGDGATGLGTSNGSVVVETADVVYCIHCKTKQPKDYKSGDLCPSCGKQAEPILTCFWCSSSGPGKFCRRCGAEFVPTGELELALLLKREGIPKQDIPQKLRGLSADDKEQLWGRVRRSHG
jgi:hypothetical protein